MSDEWREWPKGGGKVHVTATVGDNTYIGPGAVVEEFATVGPGADIGHFAFIGPGAVLGKAAEVESVAFINHHAVVGDFASVGRGAVLSPYSRVEPEVRIAPGSSIAPRQTVRHDTIAIEGGLYRVTLSDSGIRIGCQGPYWPEEWVKKDLATIEPDTDYADHREPLEAAIALWHAHFEYYREDA